MARKATGLDKLALGKPSLAGTEAEPEAQDGEGTKGQTLRLRMSAWRQLKILGIERGQPVHELLIEAVNDLFKKHGKPPIA